jgi:hypothetical protein
MTILWHLTIAVAMVLLSACAAVSPERTALEESARRASNSADHLAIAEQYEVFARRAVTLSLDYDARARTQEYLDALGGSNRPSRQPSIFAFHWRMRAVAEAVEAEQAKAQAQQHRDMA